MKKRNTDYRYGIVGLNELYDSLKEARQMFRYHINNDSMEAMRIKGETAMHDRIYPNHKGKYIYRINIALDRSPRSYFHF